ncbi:MAG: TonB-dependent receptor [Thermomonas hydrothermalis]|uniref:TonB-dependent receptor n=1 Tax=Thermomonas hydrothermalis TaxID=213588 RepID=UPI00235383EF|nr:TonB-dependent receptor [Thermomonas hydrothermalis]MCL6619115.1 TonB-dependent receptor [Thermomonas hydrothermalis]
MASNYLSKGIKRSALAVALGLCFAGGVQAQSTTGSINGTAPAGATITVTNNSGFSRTVTVDANGRYNIGNLPVGSYTVISGNDKREVVVTVGSSVPVSFGTGATTLETVTVVGSTIAPIDATTLDARSVITAQQLQRLPIARSAEAIALLAPGAISGAAGYFGGLVSFGGSGVSENAYYVNGFFTGEPVSNLGGFTLPFQAIEQQETFIGGYSAKYGRSDGGVINQIGKRGSNDWHFGGQVTYIPKSLRGDVKDLDFPNISLPSGYSYEDPTLPGTLYQRGKDNVSWSHSYTAYASGPIVKDRLFFFALGEWNRSEATSTPTALAATPRLTDNTTKNPKLYGKLDWTITDNHYLEYTYLKDKSDRTGEFYAYNFSDGSIGSKLSEVPDPFYQKNEYNIVKYTGYLTDTLTLSALYGESTLHKRQINPSIIPGLPLLGGVTNQDPSITGGTPIRNNQSGAVGIDAKDKSKGTRVDLEWVLGNHTLTAGIDNIKFEAFNEGQDQLVDRWIYGRASADIVPGHVGPSPRPGGYYVYKLIFKTATSMSLDQKAYYLEDRWQVTDNFLLSLGIRNDRFTNRNNVGEAYLDAKDQWAPRIGFSWDVNGDASMKVFGNAGRYFLALPNNVAIRGASASTFTREYFSYTGIDPATGAPTGLTPIPRTDGGSGPYSANGEYGLPVDVKSFAPSDLKNMYQDEFILGMERMLAPKWMLGVKLTHRSLKSAVDDMCDPDALMNAAGLTPVGTDAGKIIAVNTAGTRMQVAYCYMFNPGGSNTYSFANVDSSNQPTGTRTEYKISSAQLGFDQGVKRTYNALDLYLERPWDGKWEARIDYTFSKSQGNTEGQVKSEFGQTNISKTQDWDSPALMRYSYGYLANDRRHQLKLRGSYALTDEILVSTNIRIISGAPISCLGYFNPGNINENDPAADPVGYGSSYHTCFGQVATPGSVRTPWTKTIDVGLTYKPSYFDKKLALGIDIRNLLNARKTLQVDVTSEEAPYTVSNTYLLPIARQTPRTVQFTASYDW